MEYATIEEWKEELSHMPNFSTLNHNKITEFIEKFEKRKILRKVAVFDADGTLWRGDIGESFFKYQIKKHWLTPKKIGMPEGTDLWNLYWNEVNNGDKAKAYAWLAQWCAGTSIQDMERWCLEFMKNQREISVFESMRTLTHSLMNAGFEVWVVSASPLWPVLEGVKGFGVQPDHVVGVSVEVVNGILTDKIVTPISYREGKVEVIKKRIGIEPLLVAGNTLWDKDMLEMATEVSLVIHSEKEDEPNYQSEKELADYALQKNMELNEALQKGLPNVRGFWLIQKF